MRFSPQSSTLPIATSVFEVCTHDLSDRQETDVYLLLERVSYFPNPVGTAVYRLLPLLSPN